MRIRSLLMLALLLGPAAASAQPRPQKIGDFQSWTAASFTEGGQKTCYAFTRPSKAEGNRQGVMLTVTHRHTARDTVTISAGYTFPRNAEANVTVSANDLNFYTVGATAAARDGATAVRYFRTGKEAVMRAPGANGKGTVTDTFPLAGFGAAYDAISKECPAAGGGKH
ncbi:invasion associated locus B family protein [Paracraurococcus lichenis]|uniref:Invasion associated locus B family protein n=1 Tax=Paracraurococcus lichenis TaxID=3064888 RepID=A0ABT9DZ42_9PROT|nr:invasion associated locus B family protein [Paracraurococcus sp. LOR1-02]MDO9709178.1 invasion associated locus B family protein [Paracraurococcus sp. LOR1-02]